MDIPIKEENSFRFIESGAGSSGETLLLLHGLFGALSNFEGIIKRFSGQYNVVVPILPIYEMPIFQVSVMGLVDFVTKFVNYRGYDKVHLLGNSLGGHIALLYALAHPEHIASITLTGSSGLFESAFGTAFPKRGDYEYIKKKTEDTFYSPEVASKELVDEVFGIVNDRNKAIRVVATAKSAVRHNLGDKLHKIKAPALLIWGKQDNVTPAFVGEKFHELIENSRLFFLDECGHAPMMEKPDEFNTILENFLQEVITEKVEA
ncbi:MAG: alpha/beta fold hydrolase [Saprospiraceae bacterium]|nr:alpha/beta fold hydrolase [Saprospiraceae bacterium]MCB0573189.1 alpha/beta fold hydrolase [Saprospiraceae bacterium]MCB9305036.1 alpha/beta fold hydrolase [Lewinellaceae bacterium]MCB9353314.1 alpha/beta fold hydrolase [Lewinellaceae bacterium]